MVDANYSRLRYDIMCPDITDQTVRDAVTASQDNLTKFIKISEYVADRTPYPCLPTAPTSCFIDTLDDILDDRAGAMEPSDALTGLVYTLMIKKSASVFKDLEKTAYYMQQRALRLESQNATLVAKYIRLRSQLLERLQDVPV